jgi:DNA-binding response OmpR family regulator
VKFYKMGNLKILLIDNEANLLDACHNIFKGDQYELQSVSNKEQAQQMINTSFDLIILGTLSPAGEMFILQRWIKRHPIFSCIPIIMIDACFHERREKGLRLFEGLEMEAEEYLSKPLDQAELAAIVYRLGQNIISPDRRQMRETCWQAFLALDKEDRKIVANRILQLGT